MQYIQRWIYFEINNVDNIVPEQRMIKRQNFKQLVAEDWLH